MLNKQITKLNQISSLRSDEKRSKKRTDSYKNRPLSRSCVYKQQNISRSLLSSRYAWVWRCSTEPVGESARAHAALPLPAESGVHQQRGELNTAVKADVALGSDAPRCRSLSGPTPTTSEWCPWWSVITCSSRYCYIRHRGFCFCCLFVCLSGWSQNNSKSDKQILMKFSGAVNNGPRNRWSHFDNVPDYHFGLN